MPTGGVCWRQWGGLLGVVFLGDSDGHVAVKDPPREQDEQCVRVVCWVGGDQGPVCLSHQWLS